MPRRPFVAAIIAGLMTLANTGIAQMAAARPDVAPRKFAADMSLPSAERAMQETAIRVAPGVFVFHAPLGDGPVPLANEMLIEQRDGLVLVDAGKTRGAGQRIVRLIRSVSPKPVKAVILTHWHQDHVLGLGPIVEAWPNAAIVASVATREAFLGAASYRDTPRAPGTTAGRDSSRAAALSKYADEYRPNIHDATLSEEERRGWADVVGVLDLRISDEQGTYLVIPTVTFTGRYVIDDPVNPVEALSIGPAHTADDIVVWARKQHVVAAGDVVVAPIPYGARNVLEWPTALETIESVHAKVIVPGHGPIQTSAAYVDRMIAALSEIRAKVEPLAGGPPLADDSLMAKIDLSKTRQPFAGGDRWLAYWFDRYFAPNAVSAYHELRERTPRAASHPDHSGLP
jgi:glyoxylase-like metal-dependent hydrolase (beta-lactamase superfamily II)